MSNVPFWAHLDKYVSCDECRGMGDCGYCFNNVEKTRKCKICAYTGRCWKCKGRRQIPSTN